MNTDMKSAPRDRPIIVSYNHNADPYQDPKNPDKLTPYAVHSESGDFMDGKGVCIARWSEGWYETEDEYGNEYWMPAVWCAWFNNDYADQVVFPVAWMEIPEYKEENK